MAQRTQIYLTATQRKRLDAIAAREGKTLAQVIREAVDAYVGGETATERVEALLATFGAIPDMEVPLRDEWQRA